MTDSGTLARQLAELASRVSRLEAEAAIRRLHHAYGYFMDYCWKDRHPVTGERIAGASA